jgi:hypothetical protein
MATAEHGMATASSSCEDVPTQLVEHPRYEIVGLIGKGGMGAVYRARHRMMERAVALAPLVVTVSSSPVAVEEGPSSPATDQGSRTGFRKRITLGLIFCLLVGVPIFFLYLKDARDRRIRAAYTQLSQYLKTGESDEMSLNSLKVLLAHSEGHEKLAIRLGLFHFEAARIETGKWYDLVCSHDRASGTVRVCLSGVVLKPVQIGKKGFNVEGPPNEEAAKEWVFRNPGNAYTFHGVIDEFIGRLARVHKRLAVQRWNPSCTGRGICLRRWGQLDWNGSISTRPFGDLSSEGHNL